MGLSRAAHSLPTFRSRITVLELQEAFRKDSEHIFGDLQSRFHKMRKESHAWNEKFIVWLSGVQLTLHNMLVRIQQYREFAVDDGDEDSGVDII